MTRVLTIVVVVAGLIVAGCGGDDETTTTTSTPSAATGASGATGAEGGAVGQINQICKDTDKEIDQAFRESPDAGIAAIEDAIDQMKAVEGAEDDSGIANFIDAAEDDLAALQGDPASLGPESFSAADEAADEAGLTDCVG